MTFVIKVVEFSLLIFLHFKSSHAFLENIGRKEKIISPNSKIRPDLYELVSQQANKQLNIHLHVGDEESGFFSVKGMIVRLGGSIFNEHESGNETDEHEEDIAEMLPLSDDGLSSGGQNLDVLSKGTYVTMEGLQHVDCDRGSWEVCWARGSPAGTLIFAFHLPETHHRNEAVLPGGNLLLSFPVWTEEGLKYGQEAKRKVLEEIEFYDRKWNAELDKYEMTENPILKMIHEWWAHFYATKSDELYDYTLDTIPNDEDCHKLQEDFLLSGRGLIWKREGDYDVLIGHAIASPLDTNPLLSSLKP